MLSRRGFPRSKLKHCDFIRALISNVWDPIGVNKTPGEDGGVAELIKRGGDNKGNLETRTWQPEIKPKCWEYNPYT